MAQDLVQSFRRDPGKQRQMRNQRCVDLGHSASLALGSVMTPAIVLVFAIAQNRPAGTAVFFQTNGLN